jgi:A/G-specific adenine glycosylase
MVAVQSLPGIGRYTAGAILSIAYDQRVPILEANTTRLFSRLVACPRDPAAAEAQRLLWAVAEAVLPRRGVGTFNQALMELGGEICLARAPRCDTCPIAHLCEANHRGLQDRIPRAKPRPSLTALREAVVLVHRRGRVLVLRCPEGRRWAGLWDFPRYSITSQRSAALQRELRQKLRAQTGITIRSARHLRTIKHGVTRFRITLECYEAVVSSAAGAPDDSIEAKWLRPAELARYPLNTTARRISRLAE